MKKYFVNTGRGIIHLSNSHDGRCKIAQIAEERRAYYDTLEEAMQYPKFHSSQSKAMHVLY